MSARRPLLTALGATSLLAALWFVPSANATAPGDADTHTTLNALTTQTLDAPATDPLTAPAAGPATDPAAEPATDPAAGPVADPGAPEPRPASATALALADTGGVDTTPYLLGGTLCLGLGAGFVAFSVRRSQAG
ncbi:hypothetical protein [Streptomyces goshikiensis]|uniref:hypothetical protein n=1 Tax=Streptomyces goshikiensis TaxID=1942 RepID=UPI00331E66A2